MVLSLVSLLEISSYVTYFYFSIFPCYIGKAFPGDGAPETKESPLVVCFGEMLIDFVPTISGLSLADAPAFKKAPGGAPANVAVGISRLGGSSAFIGKVLYKYFSGFVLYS